LPKTGLHGRSIRDLLNARIAVGLIAAQTRRIPAILIRPGGNLWLNHQSVCFLLESLPPPEPVETGWREAPGVFREKNIAPDAIVV
jgi:hypothetical protein